MKLTQSTIKFFLTTVMIGFTSPSLNAAPPAGLQITPDAFDFGWAPDNAKISCDFVAKNVGTDLIPLTSVQPTCGCTATNFKPEELSSSEEVKINLTFNTRGYNGMRFNKASKVKTNIADSEAVVTMKGFVMDPAAKVVPVGDGIAGFEPGAKEKRKVIAIENKGTKEVSLKTIQQPASWAKVKLSKDSIPAGGKIEAVVAVEGSLDEARDTSITLATMGGDEESRLTLAIRTGPTPPPYQKYQPPTPPEKSGETETKPSNKK